MTSRITFTTRCAIKKSAIVSPCIKYKCTLFASSTDKHQLRETHAVSTVLWNALQPYCCYYHYLLYQLGTGGCTQKVESVQGVYP